MLSNIILDISVRVFLDEINIYITVLYKGDGPQPISWRSAQNKRLSSLKQEGILQPDWDQTWALALALWVSSLQDQAADFGFAKANSFKYIWIYEIYVYILTHTLLFFPPLENPA